MMSLKLVYPLLAFSVLTVAGTASVEADQISRNNPYRSFNISGINYGSQQWEREHRQVQSKPAPVRPWRRGFFRR